MPDELSYVYAVGTRIPHGVFTDLRGIGDRPVRPVRVGGDLDAVVSTVDAADFAPTEIESKLQDLDWISTTARAHHHVVDTVGRHAVVAPIALATVYLDDGRVTQVLSERHDAITEVLDRLRGRAEWGVKAWVAATSQERTGRASSGAEYLRRRRAAVRSSERETDAAYDAAEGMHASVAGVSEAARRHRLHEPALSGRSEPMVLNAAYLVDDVRVEEWRAAVERSAATSDLAVEVTGPWVPYSFAEVAAR